MHNTHQHYNNNNSHNMLNTKDNMTVKQHLGMAAIGGGLSVFGKKALDQLKDFTLDPETIEKLDRLGNVAAIPGGAVAGYHAIKAINKKLANRHNAHHREHIREFINPTAASGMAAGLLSASLGSKIGGVAGAVAGMATGMTAHALARKFHQARAEKLEKEADDHAKQGDHEEAAYKLKAALQKHMWTNNAQGVVNIHQKLNQLSKAANKQ